MIETAIIPNVNLDALFMNHPMAAPFIELARDCSFDEMRVCKFTR
jgi:hypothetical protein